MKWADFKQRFLGVQWVLICRHHLCYDISLEVKGSSHKHIISASHPVQSFGQNPEDLESRQGAKAAG